MGFKLCLECILCGKRKEIWVNNERYKKFINHEAPVQVLFPHIDTEALKMLTTLTCTECWYKWND